MEKEETTYWVVMVYLLPFIALIGPVATIDPWEKNPGYAALVFSLAVGWALILAIVVGYQIRKMEEVVE